LRLRVAAWVVRRTRCPLRFARIAAQPWQLAGSSGMPGAGQRRAWPNGWPRNCFRRAAVRARRSRRRTTRIGWQKRTRRSRTTAGKGRLAGPQALRGRHRQFGTRWPRSSGIGPSPIEGARTTVSPQGLQIRNPVLLFSRPTQHENGRRTEIDA